MFFYGRYIMARFCSLFSSSSGNCTYVGSSGANLLFDVGMNAKQTELALGEIGVDPSDIDAVFITHEHTDHICGVRVFAARYGIKIYALPGTINAMLSMNALNDKNDFEAIGDKPVEVGGFCVRPFRTQHDAAESCGYTMITPDSKRISICTDLGTVTDTVMENIYGSDLVLLESNHDVNMLRNGPYPYPLKRRILSDYGHLSNDCCAETAVKLVEGGTTRLFLGHLSKENNIPALALAATKSALESAGAVENSDYLLGIAASERKITAF